LSLLNLHLSKFSVIRQLQEMMIITWNSPKEELTLYINETSKFSTINESKFYMTWIGESSNTYDFHYENSKPQSPCVGIIIQLKK